MSAPGAADGLRRLVTAGQPGQRVAPNRPIILASTSRYRQALLSRLGVPFVVVDPAVDEAPTQATATDARSMVTELARLKATAPAQRFERGLLVGSDQCAEVLGERLGKPGSVEAAHAQLRRLAGKTHRLWTAVAVHDVETGRTEVEVDVTSLTMRQLTDAQIQAYIARDNPIDCAGSYKIEKGGPALFERIETSDPTAIEGLPLTVLARLLLTHGVDVL